MKDMKRINRIWKHPMYQECLKKIAECERNRRVLQTYAGAFS